MVSFVPGFLHNNAVCGFCSPQNWLLFQVVWEHVQAKIISKMCQWLLYSMTYLI